MTEELRVITAIREHPEALPNDPDCGAMRLLSVPLGSLAIFHIQGSETLFMIFNPDDGREPYQITRGPDQSQDRVTVFHRSNESEDDDDDL